MYKLTNGNIILRSDGASIPLAVDNLDYQNYQRWLAQGNTPTPADVPSHNDVIDAQIVAVETEHPVTKRDYREFKLAVAMQAGLPSAWLDPAQPDPSASPQFQALGFGLQIAVIEERTARALRGQRT